MTNKYFVITKLPEVSDLKKTLNFQVFEDLLNKIQSNFYKVGDKLPTEKEMMEIYDVSRAPIRQALGKLQAEGLIERRPGIGTVVVENPGTGPWTPMGGFSLQFSKRWNQLSCKTIEVVKTIPEERIYEALKLPEDKPVVRVTRVRLHNEDPVFLLKHYYVDVDEEKIKAAGEILLMRQFAKEVLGIHFSSVTEEITAVSADEHLSYFFNVEVGYPLLCLNRVSFDESFKPVEYVEYYVKSDNWPYKVTYVNDKEEFDI